MWHTNLAIRKIIAQKHCYFEQSMTCSQKPMKTRPPLFYCQILVLHLTQQTTHYSLTSCLKKLGSLEQRLNGSKVYSVAAVRRLKLVNMNPLKSSFSLGSLRVLCWDLYYLISMYGHSSNMFRNKNYRFMALLMTTRSTKKYDMKTELLLLTSEVPECFKTIKNWMARYFLLINGSKTHAIVFGSTAVLSTLSVQGVFIDEDICIRFSPIVKNIGFRLDSCLTLKYQVEQLKQSCCHKLEHIANMKNFLTEKQLSMLVHAVILLRIDYCNSLYYGCKSSVIRQLQSIKNRACRIVCGLKKRDNVKC